jgi:hypothetical protein
MTLLSVVKDVCATVGVAMPQAVIPATGNDRTMQEMLSLANEMAQRIASDQREWTQLKATCTFIGDGITTAWDLPADFGRMLLATNVWRSTSTQSPMRFIADTDEWLNRRAADGDDNAWGEWTLIGGQMHIWPPLSALVPAVPAVPEDIGPPYVPPQAEIPAIPAGYAYFAYLQKNCIALGVPGGGFSDTFVNDTDTFILGERLLRLGMIWQWKAQKGSSYAEEMATYTDALNVRSGSDSPAPILISRKQLVRGWDAYY